MLPDFPFADDHPNAEGDVRAGGRCLSLAARPSSVAWEPLQRLAAVPGDSEGRIREVVHDFSQKHGLPHEQANTSSAQRAMPSGVARSIGWLQRMITR